MAGVEPIDKATPVPPADSWLPANGLTNSQPESLPNSLPNQCISVNQVLTDSATSDTVSDGSQAGQDQTAPLR